MKIFKRGNSAANYDAPIFTAAVSKGAFGDLAPDTGRDADKARRRAASKRARASRRRNRP